MHGEYGGGGGRGETPAGCMAAQVFVTMGGGQDKIKTLTSNRSRGWSCAIHVEEQVDQSGLNNYNGVWAFDQSNYTLRKCHMLGEFITVIYWRIPFFRIFVDTKIIVYTRHFPVSLCLKS